MQLLIQRNGEQGGPYDLAEIKAHLAEGTLLSTDLVSHDGGGTWEPLGKVLFDLHVRHVGQIATACGPASSKSPGVEPQTPPEKATQPAALRIPRKKSSVGGDGTTCTVVHPVASRASRKTLLIAAGVVALLAASITTWRLTAVSRIGADNADLDAFLATAPTAPVPLDLDASSTSKPIAPWESAPNIAEPRQARLQSPDNLVAFDLVALAKKSRSAVVLIEVFDRANKAIATGSGFFVSNDGMLVTNFHVVENAHTVIAKAENGAMYQVEGAISADQTSDLALLKAAAKGVPFLSLGDSQKAETGEQVAVIGSPLGLEGSLSAGIISAKRDLPTGGQWLQITAPISPGSSGSPVMNANGEVIGVASMLLRDSQALNFAIPSETVRMLVKQSEGYAKLLPFPDTREQQRLAESDAASKKAKADAAAALNAIDAKYEAKSRELQRIQEAYSSSERSAAEGAARSAITTSNWGPALKAAQVLVNKFPEFSGGHAYLGDAYENMGFSEDAISAFQRAVKLDPSEADAWRSLGNLFNEQRKTSQATSAFAQAIAAYQHQLELLPTARTHVSYSLGRCYLGMGKLEEARNAFLVVARDSSAPESVLAWLDLGKLYASEGNERDAVMAFRNSASSHLESTGWTRLYFYYEEKGFPTEALKAKGIAWELHLKGR